MLTLQNQSYPLEEWQKEDEKMIFFLKINTMDRKAMIRTKSRRKENKTIHLMMMVILLVDEEMKKKKKQWRLKQWNVCALCEIV